LLRQQHANLSCNNQPFLFVKTAVTGLLTDRLFGMGRKWNGKQFGQDHNFPQQGINRFFPRSRRRQNIDSTPQETTITKHAFDMSIRPSNLGEKEMSLVLDYSKHQFPLSLWRTMTDEIRVVPVLEGGDARVLIGLGYMAWSGGQLNSSPFLLYRKEAEEDITSEATFRMR
jgi:hypothetical protein